MRSVSSIAEAVADAATTFSGQFLEPTDGGYDEARRVHNGLVDKRPALIAKCCDVADAMPSTLPASWGSKWRFVAVVTTWQDARLSMAGW